MASEAELQADLQKAMKARAMEKVYVLRDLITAMKNLKVERQVPTLNEADIAALVRKEMSKRAEAADYARKANRADLVTKNESEKELLAAYLPQQLDAEALATVIKALAAELGTKQIGPLMAALRERFAGQFDGKVASELIRKLD
jgi:uncharacterized protein YqeY